MDAELMHALNLDALGCVERFDGTIAHSLVCPASDRTGPCGERERLAQLARERRLSEPLRDAERVPVVVTQENGRARQLQLDVELFADEDAPLVDVLVAHRDRWLPVGRLRVRPASPGSEEARVEVLAATVPHSHPYLVRGGALFGALPEIGRAAMCAYYAAESRRNREDP